MLGFIFNFNKHNVLKNLTTHNVTTHFDNDGISLIK